MCHQCMEVLCIVGWLVLAPLDPFLSAYTRDHRKRKSHMGRSPFRSSRSLSYILECTHMEAHIYLLFYLCEDTGIMLSPTPNPKTYANLLILIGFQCSESPGPTGSDLGGSLGNSMCWFLRECSHNHDRVNKKQKNLSKLLTWEHVNK